MQLTVTQKNTGMKRFSLHCWKVSGHRFKKSKYVLASGSVDVRSLKQNTKIKFMQEK